MLLFSAPHDRKAAKLQLFATCMRHAAFLGPLNPPSRCTMSSAIYPPAAFVRYAVMIVVVGALNETAVPTSAMHQGAPAYGTMSVENHSVVFCHVVQIVHRISRVTQPIITKTFGARGLVPEVCVSVAPECVRSGLIVACAPRRSGKTGQ